MTKEVLIETQFYLIEYINTSKNRYSFYLKNKEIWKEEKSVVTSNNILDNLQFSKLKQNIQTLKNDDYDTVLTTFFSLLEEIKVWSKTSNLLNSLDLISNSNSNSNFFWDWDFDEDEDIELLKQQEEELVRLLNKSRSKYYELKDHLISNYQTSNDIKFYNIWKEDIFWLSYSNSDFEHKVKEIHNSLLWQSLYGWYTSYNKEYRFIEVNLDEDNKYVKRYLEISNYLEENSDIQSNTILTDWEYTYYDNYIDRLKEIVNTIDKYLDSDNNDDWLNKYKKNLEQLSTIIENIIK